MPAVSVGQEDNIDIEINYEVHGSGQPGVLIDGYPLTTSWCWPGDPLRTVCESPAAVLRRRARRVPARRSSRSGSAVRWRSGRPVRTWMFPCDPSAGDHRHRARDNRGLSAAAGGRRGLPRADEYASLIGD